MAYLEARAGLARSGVTLSGLYTRFLGMTIGGASAAPAGDSIVLSEMLDGPATLRFVLQGAAAAPARWSTVRWRNGGVLRFGGHILRVTRVLEGFAAGPVDVTYEVEAIDWTWLLDLRSRVTHRYYTQPVNGIVAHLIRTYTEGGFVPGYLPSALGSVAMGFTGETVSGCLSRIAKACGAYWWIGADQSINMAAERPAGLTITDSTRTIEALRWEDDGSQIRTRVDFIGGSAALVSPYAAGSSTLALDQVAPFASAGGRIQLGYGEGTYAGKSAESGPGTLTGVSLAVDGSAGDEVRMIERREDAGAQTALGSAIGGGHSGIAVHALSDGRVSSAAAGARAAGELAAFSSEIRGASFVGLTEQYRPGVPVAVSLTTPEAITASLLIQSTETRLEGPCEAGAVQWRVAVTAKKWQRDLVGLLGAIEDARWE